MGSFIRKGIPCRKEGIWEALGKIESYFGPTGTPRETRVKENSQRIDRTYRKGEFHPAKKIHESSTDKDYPVMSLDRVSHRLLQQEEINPQYDGQLNFIINSNTRCFYEYFYLTM